MTDAKFVFFGDLVEENGKTIRENNLEKGHAIPLGSLVEVEITEWYANKTCLEGTVQMYVAEHGRDCDGTPLYWLCPHRYNRLDFETPVHLVPDEERRRLLFRIVNQIDGGYSEDGLRVVALPDSLPAGDE